MTAPYLLLKVRILRHDCPFLRSLKIQRSTGHLLVDYQMPFMHPSHEGHAINHIRGILSLPFVCLVTKNTQFDIVNSAPKVIGQVPFQSVSAQRNLYNMHESQIRLIIDKTNYVEIVHDMMHRSYEDEQTSFEIFLTCCIFDQIQEIIILYCYYQ
jgi:hypothetical protein